VSKTRSSKNQSAGFTLLEVLIALAIFGTTVAFLLGNVTSQQRAQEDMRIRSIAQWVALNRLNELRLQPGWPAIGVRRGETDMARHTWYWQQKVSKTSEKALRQVEIEVYYLKDDELPAASARGFFAQVEERN